MFISNSHMPQVLEPAAYYSTQHLQAELDRLFLPGWHFVGLVSEIPNDGDFLTQELFGNPIIVWNKQGEVHAFLNVCAHRMCMLTHQPRGCMPQLHCQYHGWEYDETGNTRRIPDARSFRPMQPGIVGLRKFRTETVGRAIFLTMNESAPWLKDYLGPGYDLAEEVTSGTWAPVGISDREMDANWKTYIENTIETYHAATVHPKTLKVIPDEETCEHSFGERWSHLKTCGKSGKLDILDRAANRALGLKRDSNYQNLLIYPNIAVGKMSLFSWIDAVVPVGPNRMRVIARGFMNRGDHGFLRAGLARHLVSRWGRKFFTQLVAEDAAVLPDVQRGIRSPLQPLGGLISTREERIFHFQKFIQAATSIAEVAPSDEKLPERRRSRQTLGKFDRVLEAASETAAL